MSERYTVPYRQVLLFAAAFVVSCGAPTPPGVIGQQSSAVFVNGDFETGTVGAVPASWTLATYSNATGVTIQAPQTRAGLNLTATTGTTCTTASNCGGTGYACTGGFCGPSGRTSTLGGGTNQADPNLGTGASLRYCRYGSQCALVNSTGLNKNVNSLSQTMTLAAGDVDGTDNKIHIRFVVAPVLQDPGHTSNQQPYFFVQLTNVTQGTTLYSNFNFSNQSGVPWKAVGSGTSTIRYTDWQLVDVASDGTSMKQGDIVTLEIIASGCQPGGHWGQVYVDGVGSTIPGLFISGAAPSQVAASTNIPYTLTYTNGSSASETGVVITFTTPPNTTFASITPPAGATCTTPAVLTSGTVTCTFSGAVAAGASGTMTITVTPSVGNGNTITAGTYDISSTQETKLLGNVLTTYIGCTADAQCTAGNWCDETTHGCTATLANSATLPTDAAHSETTLNGMCTPAAGALVCTSAVCDGTMCGYANTDGPCTTANGATVCRSGVCGSNGVCGYATGQGPCTVLDAGTVCQSGSCSLTAGTCIPVGGCNVDADCTGGAWCQESTHVCTSKLTNGSPLPTDAPHTNPTLDGTCTTAAANLVCSSSVCDTNDNDCGYANADGSCTALDGGTVCRSGVCDLVDGKCGYATGDGPCTTSNAMLVCRSGVCSTNGACEPIGGCNVDADCTGGTWCSEATHACLPTLANGAPIPTDAPHTNPTLNGTCTVAAATLVCTSQVCDTNDNDCGYANGDGNCTLVDASTVCRSGTCDVNDTKCGLADGDGPCVPGTAGNGATICRSTACGANSLCRPLGGCNVDADCASTQFCTESTHKCTDKLPNGAPIPTDAPHTLPALAGVCTADAAALVCTSQVCDLADNLCGYANGDGPCTSTTGATVCRSGTCSANSTCVAAAGCNIDSDCTGGTWCNQSAHVCTAKIANGSPLPTDAPHTSPTLNGTCTTDAATLVCASAVCDTKDNDCGYADGDGTCTTGANATVCRSTMCSHDGTCQHTSGCNVDADCIEPAAPKCDTTTFTCVAVAGSDLGGTDMSTTGDAAVTKVAPSLNGGGGAGCSAVGGSGADGALVGLVLFALALLGARRRRAAFFFSLLISLVVASSAEAQTQGAAVNIFRSASAGSDWFTLDSMDYRGKIRAAVNATLDYGHDTLVVYNPDGSRLTAPIRHQGWLDIGASVMLFERIRIAATLPVAFYQAGSSAVLDGVETHPAGKGGLGDLRLGADVRLFGRYGHAIQMSVGGEVTFPTGSQKDDLSTGSVTGDVHAAIAGDISLFTYAVQVGFDFRRHEQIDNVRFNDSVRFAAAVGVRLVKKRLLIGPEFFGVGDVGHSAGQARKGLLEGDLGVHYKFDMGLRIGAGVGTGLVRSPGVPDVRVLANVGWMMPYKEKAKVVRVDRDGDGIYDVDDACPDVPGVGSSNPAQNGCPADRDHDGVLDSQDLCPDQPKGEHPDPARLGCPEKDTDADGIYDSVDQCVDVAAGAHPDPKRAGCPDKDSDGDGFYDSNDLCPSEPAGLLPDVKRPGCPLPDRDADRVPDATDACPDKPGSPSADPKKNGCPGLVTVTGTQIAILRPVLFATGKDVILPSSFPVLQAVAETMQAVTSIKRISIEGHTDAQGNAAKNLDLSDRRAQSVRNWLVAHGVEEQRLVSKGFGQTQPVATNATGAGRARNRRVDFVIVPIE